jgi:hypothetical protein
LAGLLFVAQTGVAFAQSDGGSVPQTDVEGNCRHVPACIVAERQAYDRVREIWGRVNGYSRFVCRMGQIGFGPAPKFYRSMVPCLENALFNQEGFNDRKARAQGFRE